MKLRMSRSLVALRPFLSVTYAALAALTFVSAHAQAVSADEKAAAQEHFDRGVQAFEDRRFAEAAAEFNTAYQIAPAYALLYNIGQVNTALGNSVEAVDAYEKYLAQAGTSIPEKRRKAVVAELEDQRARIGLVMLTAAPEGAEVRVDGRLIGKAPLHDPVRLSAGKHSIMLLADGYTAQVREVEVAGRAQTELELKLEPTTSSDSSGPAVSAPTTTAPQPAAAAPSTVQTIPVVLSASHGESDHAGSIQRGLGYAVGGLGIALVASGGVLAIVSASQANSASNRMTSASDAKDPTTWDSANSDYTSAKSRNQLGLIGVGVGSALLVGGGLLVLTAPSPRPVAAWSVAPVKTANFTGFAARAVW
jgi:hypothetical protein